MFVSFSLSLQECLEALVKDAIPGISPIKKELCMPVARSEKFSGDALAFPTALRYKPPPPRCVGMHSRLREVSERASA